MAVDSKKTRKALAAAAAAWRKILLCLWAVVVVVVSTPVVTEASSTTTTTTATSSSTLDLFGNNNLGPSMMASASQGTTMAMPCWVIPENDDDNNNDNDDDDEDSCPNGVLILLRTPGAVAASSNKNNKPKDKEEEEEEEDENSLPMGGDLRLQYDNLPCTSASSQRWQILTHDIVLCCTGFSPDVHLVTRWLQTQVDAAMMMQRQDQTPPVVQLMQATALQFSAAAASLQGRPYGVAVLMIGRSTNGRRWQLWTLDPAGTLVSRTTAAVIGKHAVSLQRALVGEEEEEESLDETTSTKTIGTRRAIHMTPRRVLRHMLRACVEEQQGNNDAAAAAARDGYEAILLTWRDDNSMHVGHVHPAQVQDCLQSVVVGDKKRELQ